MKFLGHLEHEVRLANSPTFGELPRLWRIFGGSFRRARVYPLDNRPGLGRRQRAIVGEFTMRWVGVPGRHSPEQHRRFDRLGPRSSFPVIEKRHGCNVSRAMTGLTTILENGKY